MIIRHTYDTREYIKQEKATHTDVHKLTSASNPKTASTRQASFLPRDAL